MPEGRVVVEDVNGLYIPINDVNKRTLAVKILNNVINFTETQVNNVNGSNLNFAKVALAGLTITAETAGGAAGDYRELMQYIFGDDPIEFKDKLGRVINGGYKKFKLSKKHRKRKNKSQRMRVSHKKK